MSKKSNKKNIFSVVVVLTIIGLLGYLAYKDTLTTKEPVEDTKNTFIGLYMIGSDLEDDVNPQDGKPDSEDKAGGYGTQDLDEIVEGLKSLNKNQDANLDIYIAFGGARTKGWKGVKYADESCLVADAKNGKYGDADCYDLTETSANMADKRTYQNFLDRINDISSGYERTFLINWDHGGDYLGYGNDTNFEGSYLSLTDLKDAYQKSNSKFDIIGFDACLMGSLEVGNAVNNATDYLLASEENEPGHGWDYKDVVKIVAESSDSSITDMGKALIDSYIDSKNHEDSLGKTLSLIDMSKHEEVITSMNKLIQANRDNESFQEFVYSVGQAETYGSILSDMTAYSVDTLDMLKILETNTTSSTDSTAIQDLINKIESYVVYSRNDDYAAGSNGTSIFSANNFLMYLNKGYTSEVAVSQPWYDFLDSYFKEVINDNLPPKITSKELCEHEGKEGVCISAEDNVGLKNVSLVNAFDMGGKRYAVLFTNSLYKIDSHNYFSTLTSANLFGLCNIEQGKCKDKVNIPLYLKKDLDKPNAKIYTTLIQVNNKDALLKILLNKESSGLYQKDSYSYTPFTTVGGELVPSKQEKRFEKGDKVKPIYKVYDVKSGKLTFVPGPNLLTLDNFEWTSYEPDQETIRVVTASDLSGNFTIIDVNSLE